MFNDFVHMPSLTTDVFPKTLRREGVANPQDLKRTHIVFDLNSGRILDQKNKNSPIHPASLTKLMTFTIMMDLIAQGRLNFDDVLKISNRAKKMHSPNSGLKSITIGDALKFAFPISFNDIGVALAEHIGWTEWRFCHEHMNPKAKSLGMVNTEFWNASGLVERDLRTTKPLPKNVTTAEDMMKLVHYMLTTYPEIIEFSSQKEVVIGNKRFRNTNPLLNDKSLQIDGLKTGTLARAGYHLITTSQQNGHRVVVISLGNYYEEQRRQHSLSLLQEGHHTLSLAENTPISLAVK